MKVAVEQHEYLRRMRRRARLSQIEVADRLHISDSALSDYENGKSESLPFDITPDEHEAAIKALIAERERES